ncbi:PAS domain-containing sensor histidine kinase [Sphingobium sp. HWE2-09]|uniref:PAS domain-containing sensor histidine kinase n=1 Tax=Sphingobium sp. HWE2-09 TaxID=3108390 RepID=UPI002DC8B45B|nr:ATP-binding protein [Sphingobium sp. HWE2-09]
MPEGTPAPSADNLEILRASPRANELFELSENGTLVGRPVSTLFDHRSQGLISAMIQAAIAGDDLEPTQACACTPKGANVSVLVTATKWCRGTVSLVLVPDNRAAEATSRLKILEERYGRLFNDVPIALMRVDSRGALQLFATAREAGYDELISFLDDHPAAFEVALDATVIVDANDQSVKMFGDGTKESVLCPVRSYYRLAPDAFKRNMAAAFAGARHYSEEVVICGAAGQEVDVLFTIAYPDDQEIEGNSFVGMVDIGDRLRAEAELQRTQGEFTRAARLSLLGELTASIAHEVMQPLSSISVNSGTAKKWLEKDPPDIARAAMRLERVAQDAERTAAIVDGMRTMAKGGRGERMSVDLQDVVRDAIGLVSHELRSNGVRLRLERPAAPLTATVDAIQIQQVVVNLILNAAQAMAQAQVHTNKIDVRLAKVANHSIEICVSDSGPGICDEHLPRLFDSFFTTKSDGIGMGLAICKSIVENHLGALTVENVPGVGAVARVLIPGCQT